MAPLAYHVIPTRLKITSLNTIKFLDTYAFINNPQWQSSGISVQILFSYFRYTSRLFLGCVLFVARCNTIRNSWKTKKERLSCRKKYIKEFVWVISLNDCTLSLLLLFSSSTPFPFPMWRTCGMAAIKLHILLWVVFCVVISWVNGCK